MAIDLVDRLQAPSGGVVADQHIISAARDAAIEIERLRHHLRHCIDELRRESARMPHRNRVAALAEKHLNNKERGDGSQ